MDAQNAQNWTASVVIGLAPNSAHNAGYRVSHNRRAVTVGNKAPVPGLASQVPSGAVPAVPLARACAQRRYDDVTGNFPA